MQHVRNIIAFMQQNAIPQERITEFELLRDNLRAIYNSILALPVMDWCAYRPPTEPCSGSGRPRYILTREQLGCLRQEFNSWTQIAADLGVSRQTIYNRRRELGFSMQFEQFTEITYGDLDALVRHEQNTFPNIGETNIIAGLRQQGIYLQRWRIRQSIIRVNPINRANRWGQRIVRRPYSVPHPNYLWHTDTHIKLCHLMDSQGPSSFCGLTTTTALKLFYSASRTNQY